MSNVPLHLAISDGAPTERRADVVRDRTREKSVRTRLQTAVLHELETNERLLILLWYAERMSPEEVALALDLTVSQVEAMHGRVVGRLADALVGA